MQGASEVVVDYDLSIASHLQMRDAKMKSKSNKRKFAIILGTLNLDENTTSEYYSRDRGWLYFLWWSWLMNPSCWKQLNLAKMWFAYLMMTLTIWQTELRVRLAPLNRFKPSSKIFYWPFQGGTSFVDLLCFCSVLCLLCLCASVYMCFVVTCWERADLLALVCGVFCEFVTFPLVSCVRCGTWLYRFLIFAPLLTLQYKVQMVPWAGSLLDINALSSDLGQKCLQLLLWASTQWLWYNLLP